MKRTQIYIPKEMQEELDSLSRQYGTSKSEIIREAVTEYLARHSDSEKKKKLKAGAGLWSEKTDVPDISKLRKEFDRFS
jgi:metal-responsive CopG/Arc/MetJ family transcriptional regulator